MDMSADKYLSIFSCQVEAFVYLFYELSIKASKTNGIHKKGMVHYIALSHRVFTIFLNELKVLTDVSTHGVIHVLYLVKLISLEYVMETS